MADLKTTNLNLYISILLIWSGEKDSLQSRLIECIFGDESRSGDLFRKLADVSNSGGTDSSTSGP